MAMPSVSMEADAVLETVSPALLEALRKIIPKRRRAKLPYIVALGLLGVVTAVAADPSAREVLAGRAHAKRSEPRAAAVASTAPPPLAEPPVATHPAANTMVIEELVLPLGPETTTPAASAAKSKKTPHRRPIPRR